MNKLEVHPQLTGVVYDTELPVVDREQLEMLLMADGDEDAKALVVEIFDIFKTEGLKKFKTLDLICQNNQLLELRNLVHYIAGSAGTLGLMRLATFYRGIEEAIDAGRVDSISNFAPQIRAEFETACEIFHQHLL